MRETLYAVLNFVAFKADIAFSIATDIYRLFAVKQRTKVALKKVHVNIISQ
jgi:hypothetical protein